MSSSAGALPPPAGAPAGWKSLWLTGTSDCGVKPLPPLTPSSGLPPICENENRILEFLKQRPNRWFDPEELREGATPKLAASTVRTYCGSVAKKIANGWRLEKRNMAPGVVHFAWNDK